MPHDPQPQRRTVLRLLAGSLLAAAALPLAATGSATAGSQEEPGAGAPAGSLGLPLERLLAGLEKAFPQRDEGMGNLYSGPGSVSDRFYSDNAHATLETLGPAEEVIALRYLYELRAEDHPEATRDNRSYAFALLRNVFPDWAEAEAWLEAAIEQAERTADSGAEPSVARRRGMDVKLRYFVGATASIELQILPKDSYI